MKNDPRDKKKVKIASVLVVMQGEVEQVLKQKKGKERKPIENENEIKNKK